MLHANESHFSASDDQFPSLHEYEVWSVCFDSDNEHVLYSGISRRKSSSHFSPYNFFSSFQGGDDSLLKVTDLRTAKSVSVRGHDAGVTSIVSDPSLDHYLLTGRRVAVYIFFCIFLEFLST